LPFLGVKELFSVVKEFFSGVMELFSVVKEFF